jgi:hypothetical protein
LDEVTAFSAISSDLTASFAISSELTASFAISSEPTESVPRSLAVIELSATLAELTALSRRSTVRTEPLTIWFEPIQEQRHAADHEGGGGAE